MGVNYHPYIIDGKTEDGYRRTKPYKGKFESKGERYFDYNKDLEWEEILDNPDRPNEMQDSYVRPKDLDKAIEEAIRLERTHLVVLFEEMKENKDLWISVSC